MLNKNNYDTAINSGKSSIDVPTSTLTVQI